MMALEMRHEVERRNGDITTLTELGGDLGAAAISATLVAPLVTAIDRSVRVHIELVTYII